jgi:hypothetical protein
MNTIFSGHMRRLKERLAFLNERIRQSEGPTGYDTREVKALSWAIRQIEDEESNLRVKKAYNNGQKNILKFYKKTLEKAVHSGNIETLQFLLDRTNEWLEKEDI